MAGIVAGVIEVAAFATLAALALGSGTQRQSAGPATHGSRLLNKVHVGIPGAGWAVAACSVLAVVILGISEAASTPTSFGSSRGLLKIAKSDGVTVLNDARGFTLYWFAPDTPSKSNCNGTCAAYWPPVIGKPVAGPGVTGKLGTVRRSGGLPRATYDGHPPLHLYRRYRFRPGEWQRPQLEWRGVA